MPDLESAPGEEIAGARQRLDELDQQIVRLVKERVSFSSLVQSARIAGGGCRTDSRRENVIIKRYHEGLGPVGRDIALSLLQLCRGTDHKAAVGFGDAPARRAFLGPAASVSQQAAQCLASPAAGELLPLESLEDVLRSLADGRAEEAVLPLENSVSGPVGTVISALATTDDLCITAQLRLSVDWVLAAAPGTPVASVAAVASHSHALAQNHEWLASVLPRAVTIRTASTAAAAAGLLQPDVPYEAVICTRQAAEHYRLHILASPEGTQAPVTRFVLVRPVPALSAPTGNDVTSLALTVPTAALSRVLECLTGTEILGLHTLPAGPAARLLWMDCRGHTTDPHMIRLWSVLREHCDPLRMTGSYPASAPVRHDAEA